MWLIHHAIISVMRQMSRYRLIVIINRGAVGSVNWAWASQPIHAARWLLYSLNVDNEAWMECDKCTNIECEHLFSPVNNHTELTRSILHATASQENNASSPPACKLLLLLQMEGASLANAEANLYPVTIIVGCTLWRTAAMYSLSRSGHVRCINDRGRDCRVR